MTSAPVLLLAFNRPGLTREVIGAIRAARPSRLYVAVDGPREGNRGDSIATASVREIVSEAVDWPCRLETLFRDENLGCRRGVADAISWFFDQEEMGIVLEDDCLPGADFFRFCEQMLARYRIDERVFHVGGSCHIKEEIGTGYFFSKYSKVWGWASWRRAWSHYDLETEDFEVEFENLSDIFTSSDEKLYWKGLLGRYFDGEIDTWDYPWLFSIWKARGLSVYSKRNLVRNIGFGRGGAHTKRWKDYRGLSDLTIEPMGRINHPAEVAVDVELDRLVFDECYRPIPKTLRLLRAARLAAARTASRTG